MMVLEHNALQYPSDSEEFSTTLAMDLVRCHHQALQQAIFSDSDQHIGRALDALGVAYGLLHNHERTSHFCTIAAEILLETGDRTGSAIALYHAQVATQMLRRQH